MGIMDLSMFVVGRKTPVLHVWRKLYPNRDHHPMDNIEPTTGLPRSLIHLLARVDEADTEFALEMWQGTTGDTTQILLWEIYRYVGILAARRACRQQRPTPQEHQLPRSEGRRTLSNETILSRALAYIDSALLVITSRQPGMIGDDTGLLCPLFILACHPHNLTLTQKSFLRAAFAKLQSHNTTATQAQAVLQVVEQLWLSPSQDVDALARDLNLEVSLL